MLGLRQERGAVRAAGVWVVAGGGVPQGTCVDRYTPSSFQKSIRPQVVTTFELPGCYDMWTVVAPVRKEQVRAPSTARRSRGGNDPVLHLCEARGSLRAVGLWQGLLHGPWWPH